MEKKMITFKLTIKESLALASILSGIFLPQEKKLGDKILKKLNAKLSK